MSNIAKSFVELIGKTPLLAATRFGKKYGADANIFAKLEYFNQVALLKIVLLQQLFKQLLNLVNYNQVVQS